MTVTRAFTPRHDACCVCGAAVRSMGATTTDPEAPEMIQLSSDAWMGVVEDQPAGEVRLIVCCSTRCLHNLLREEP